MPIDADALESGQGSKTDIDRYPTLSQALTKIHAEIASGKVVIDRLELTCLANGEVNCKWWEPRAEEPTFVFIPAAESS